MSTAKKVLILGKLPPPYMGPSIATEIILKSDLKNRFNLLHLDTRINFSIQTFGKWDFGKLGRNLAIYSKMRKMVRKEKPDLVLVPVSQTTMGFIKDAGFILIAAWAGRKVIIQLRGSNFKNWVAGSSGFIKWFVKYVLKRTKGCIVLGNNLTDVFSNYYQKEKIFVVPNGGNYIIPKRTRTDEEFKILYLANLFRAKGVEDVVEATSILNREFVGKFSVDLIGEWATQETKNYCNNLIEKEKLPVRIHSSKVSNRKFEFLTDADVFVFPPRDREGHPWCIIEAMAAGLPVISTDQGAIIESVIDGRNGFIVNPKSPQQIAEKLKLLIKDKEIRKKMGEESRKIYEEKLTEERMVENLTTVFNRIIESK